MADAGFPGQAATTTATYTLPTTVITNTPRSTTEPSDIIVRFDPKYFKTVPGIVKMTQISMCLLGFICVQVSLDRAAPRGRFYSWISMLAVTFTGILLGLYVFHVVEKYQHKVPWLKIELAYTGLWTFFFVLASSLTITQWGNNAFVAAGSIGFRATAAYGVDFYLKWGAVRRGNKAQEPRIEYQLPSSANIPVIAVVGSSAV